MSVLDKPYFHNEPAAFAFVEGILWPQGPICPHCGGFDRIYDLAKTRIGLRKCGQCRKQFTVRVGTIFESSHLPLHIWLQAVFLMCASKKGVSSHQLHRTLEITYKSAWFLTHRIREAMRTGALAPFGSGGGAVEVDETFIGHDPDHPQQPGKQIRTGQKMKVLTLVDRTTGRAHSRVIDRVALSEIGPIVTANLSNEARLMTDEAITYRGLGRSFAAHGVVRHTRNEYVQKNTTPLIHTNTVEGYFSIFKRGMRGVYQHCQKKHLHRYLAEFDFRYSNRLALGVDDHTRTVAALQGAKGKRLTYRRPDVRLTSEA